MLVFTIISADFVVSGFTNHNAKTIRYDLRHHQQHYKLVSPI